MKEKAHMRLGDEIDDYCSRCKRAQDHAVVALAGEEVQVVRCRICDHEHKYRGNKGKKEMTAKEAFDKVLASVTNSSPALQATAAKSKRKR
jgi:RNase P subunit RPR2